ncbi:calcium uniporter regulatory subunit MCUb, mitochondrial [Diceros bicornis minor]|uniref:calcium uniporter regulatory subunit MCUb, mitochondrial n=1 Tax=Diceros bicornis minor TaxID=77932 RepID=UPI0026EFF551|nr:calcium uniporter regulatory subunit MCUb, mitochondrial [Diceros bicornis minor]
MAIFKIQQKAWVTVCLAPRSSASLGRRESPFSLRPETIRLPGPPRAARGWAGADRPGAPVPRRTGGLESTARRAESRALVPSRRGFPGRGAPAEQPLPSKPQTRRAGHSRFFFFGRRRENRLARGVRGDGDTPSREPAPARPARGGGGAAPTSLPAEGAEPGARRMPLPRGPWPWRARLPPPGAPGRARPRAPTPQGLCVKLCGNLKYHQPHLYSTLVPPDEITINYRHGLPLITLTLPSRKERCRFVVKPLLSTVGSFLQDLRNEDQGVKAAAILTADGSEIPASTLMEILLMNDFKLVINEMTYDVQCPKKEKLSPEHTTEMENVKSLVHRLFTALHLEEFQKKRERCLLEKIDWLTGQLQPLEQMKARIEGRSEAKTSGLLWAGLALLSVQGGALAWLTWWVYSWDIMEPVTYFITFANSMVFFAYFIVTRQDYTFSAVRSRQCLHFFHKKSKQQQFDVAQYNKLKEDLAKANESLERVRHALYLRMRVEELDEKN